MAREKYIQSVPASPSFPFGVEALRYPNGEIIQGFQVPRVVKLSEHGLNYLRNLEEYWTNVANATFRRFPELVRGERIHSTEISKRLGEIRVALSSRPEIIGPITYEVSPYSRLSADEKWALLGRIKKDIRKKAEKYCPSALRQIDRDNQQQKEDARGDLR